MKKNGAQKNTQKRQAYHHGDVAQQLLAVSEQIIIKKGVEAFSLREAAEIVGVSPSACYRHYKNKLEILKNLASRGLFKLYEYQIKALKKNDGCSCEEEIFVLALAYLQFAQKYPAYFKIMFAPLGVDSRDPSLALGFVAGKGPYGMLLDSVDRWLKKNSIKKNPGTCAVEIWAAVHGMTCLVLNGSIRDEVRKTNSENLLQGIIKTILSGFH
ncbi:MAG: TetR/AcrR family transcriptional regulator [Bdellovibrionota bacterium]